MHAFKIWTQNSDWWLINCCWPVINLCRVSEHKSKMSKSRDRVINEACRRLSVRLNFLLELKDQQDDLDIPAVYCSCSSWKNKTNRFSCLPLESIVDNKISEARRLCISTVSLADVSEQELKAADFELLFGPAEKVLEKRFIKIFKDSTTLLNQSLAAVVVILNF